MKYCAGKGSDLGHVSALPYDDFATFCSEILEHPVQLRMSRSQFQAMTPKERGLAKRVDYFTAATFNTSPSPRRTENALTCNLIALDVDDSAQASRLLAGGGLDPLSGMAHAVWHTASSTEASPRLRIVVAADGLPLDKYKAATTSLAQLLGLVEVTTESLVPVQPMFLPTSFAGDAESPLVSVNPSGDPFGVADILDEVAQTTEVPDALDNYRDKVDGVTLEDVQDALSHLDPDMPMHRWIEMGAALKHQLGDEGYALWDAWSAKGKKYVDPEETAYRWGTLKAQTPDRAPVTIRSLFKAAQERGWTNATLTKRAFDDTVAWLKDAGRSSEELIDHGPRKIAQASTLGSMQKKWLMLTLQEVLKGRGMPLPVTDIRTAVKDAEKAVTKPTEVLPWAKGVCYITALNAFYRPASGRLFPPEVMDLMYGSVPMGKDGDLRPRDYLIQIATVPQVENQRYDPRHAEKRYFNEEGIPYVNTYAKATLKADKSRAQEAGDIFQTHIRNLVAEPAYQQTLIDFLAYQVQKPGYKVRWAVLLQGGMGCGKTFIAAAMTAVLGRRNVRKVSASNVMEGTHNSWAYGAQLCVMEEVRIVGHNRYAVMDQLKPCISDDQISYRQLYRAPQTVPNTTNYLMFTNHHDALAINDGDRRYFVLSSPLQFPAQIEALGGKAYFDKLFGMIHGNAGGLLAWLENWEISRDFSPEARATSTTYLTELAANSASPLSFAVAQAIQDAPHPLISSDLVSSTALRDALDASQLSSFSDQALGAVLREQGWVRSVRTMLNGARHQLWVKGKIADPVRRATERLEVL